MNRTCAALALSAGIAVAGCGPGATFIDGVGVYCRAGDEPICR